MSDEVIQPKRAGRRSVGRTIVQLVGFLISLGALGWAVSVALKEENRAQLENLRSASVGQIMAIVGLSFALFPFLKSCHEDNKCL